ncbi:MAG: hypothetical protein V4550_13420 [Gemmatimonadota bacterium]
MKSIVVLDRRWSAVAIILALLMTSACRSDNTRRPPNLDDVGVHLAGTWDVTLRLDRPLTLATDASSLPRTVAGTIVLLENRDPRLAFGELRAPTHVGTYDIDLVSLGFPATDAGAIPGVAARSFSIGLAPTPAERQDSVFLILNPESPRLMLRLNGTFNGERAEGVWMSETFLGGGGAFTLTRRAGVKART